MQERMKQEPFAEFDGSLLDWLHKITDPKGYARYQRSLEHGK
jgi:hypothetical protein